MRAEAHHVREAIDGVQHRLGGMASPATRHGDLLTDAVHRPAGNLPRPAGERQRLETGDRQHRLDSEQSHAHAHRKRLGTALEFEIKATEVVDEAPE